MEQFWTDDEVYRFQKQYDLLRGINVVCDTKRKIEYYRQNGSLVNCGKSEEITTLSLEEIQEIICNHYEIKSEILMSKKRNIDIIFYRQVHQYLLRIYTPMSLQNIGKYYGITHATVISNVNEVKYRIEFNKNFRAEFEELIKIIDKKLKSIESCK